MGHSQSPTAIDDCRGGAASASAFRAAHACRERGVAAAAYTTLTPLHTDHSQSIAITDTLSVTHAWDKWPTDSDPFKFKENC